MAGQVMRPSGSDCMPVDGHVHFHDLRRVGPTLDSAVANFPPPRADASPFSGVLLLAQTSREKVFESLLDVGSTGRWAFTPLKDEPVSLVASRRGSSILIVCGRQVRTNDGLEVLALGTLETFPDGLSLDQAFRAVARVPALAVLPWGLGKIMGRRRRRVEDLLVSTAGNALFVGDNGSRLAMLGPPELLRKADQLQLRTLPGTDPFPIAGDHQRVGRFGFLTGAPLSGDKPWHSLRTWLIERKESPSAYGRPCGPIQFVRIQLGIQIHNRLAQR